MSPMGRRPRGNVYFLRDHKGRIKIGYTTRKVAARVAELQTAHAEPLTILAEARGYLEDEDALHRQFEKAWLHGEWFAPTPELQELIHGLADGLFTLESYLEGESR